MNISRLQTLMIRLFLILVCLVNVFVISSCKKYSSATPAFFIKSTNVNVVTTASVQGSSSSKITELVLYIDGKYQGSYPYGNVMPIPNNNKNVRINVLAGIRNNGFKATHITWLFYDKIEIDTLVQAGKTIERAFTFKYNPDVKFAWVEGFENTAGYSIVNSAVSSTSFVSAPVADCFEGKSIEMRLITNQTISQIESALSYSLPLGSSNVYLELDYKCYQEFSLGLISSGGTQKQVMTLNPSSTWNKIYINLAEAINNPPSSTTHKIYFKMVKSKVEDDSRVFLDNIKVVHF